MRRVVITGLGFVSSIGNNKTEVLKSLREGRSGIEVFSELDTPDSPIRLAGTVKGYKFPAIDFEEWQFPHRERLAREQLRPMTPNSVYAFNAMHECIEDAALTPDLVSNTRTGMTTASGGSMWLAYDNLHTMHTRGVSKCQPLAIVNSIPGSLYINLGALFKILGGAVGFSSACSSSAHALGAAYDAIALNRQDRMFVVGAEDCNRSSILPFASIRALSIQKDPTKAPRAFDKKRDGFVIAGGAAVVLLESLDTALARGATIYAEIPGYAQTSDGFNVLAPEPNGSGLARCMDLALEATGIKHEEVDYINAHATSTSVGDLAEIKAIRKSFGQGKVPLVSSTKSLTGHGLSLAGALEAGICCLAIREGFVPVSANITELDPACEGVPIVTKPVDVKPRIVLSNSSGFGGTNVTLVFRPVTEA